MYLGRNLLKVCGFVTALIAGGCDDKQDSAGNIPPAVAKKESAEAAQPAPPVKPHQDVPAPPSATNEAPAPAVPKPANIPPAAVAPVNKAKPAAPKPELPYDATLAEGIDFKKPGYPKFIAEVSGVSYREPWGRWSDAHKGGSVKVRFKEPLPKKFTLELIARPYGPNMNQSVKVIAGKVERTFVATPAPNNIYRISFDKVKGADTVEIIPPKPTAPKDLNRASLDQRKIGLALEALRVK